MKINDPDVIKLGREIEEQEKRLHANPLFKVVYLLSIGMSCFVQ